MLTPVSWRPWFGEEPAEADRLEVPSVPYQGGSLHGDWAMRARSVANNDPALTEPVGIALRA
jgi:hypothetical protein